MFPDIRRNMSVSPAKHHIQVLIGYLGGYRLVIVPCVMMRRKIGRCGVGELTGDHQSHGLLLLHLQCLEDGSRRLPCAGTIYRVDVIVGYFGMDGDISLLLQDASGVG